MHSNDDAVAEIAIAEAFEKLCIEPWPWLDSTMHSSRWAPLETSENLRYLWMEIGLEMDWGRNIPNSKVAHFLAIFFGRNLLRYPPMRELLLKHRAVEHPQPETLLSRLCEILSLNDGATLDDALEKVLEIDWRPSTRFATEFSEIVGLPPRFAQAGSSDDRGPMLLVEPFSNLPPLLEFQNRVKQGIIEKLNESGRSLVVMPTGSGKTRTSVEAAIDFLLLRNIPIGRILWLADRDELCEQAVQSFNQILLHRAKEPVPIWRFWTGNSIDLSIEGGRRCVPGITVTSTQQLRLRLKGGDPIAGHLLDSCRIVIIDEVHRNLDWNDTIINHLSESNPDAAVIGLTATPLRRVRHETGRLAGMFENCTISPIEGGEQDPERCVSELTDMGILARRIDLSPSDLGIRLSVRDTLSKRFSESIAILKSIESRGARSTLVFGESVKQSRKLAATMSLMGFPSRHLDSGTPIAERRGIIRDFRSGEIRFLMNFDILTTGFDAPNTDAVAIFRTTEDRSQPLITQMIGRGLRGPRFDGTEECLIFIRGVH